MSKEEKDTEKQKTYMTKADIKTETEDMEETIMTTTTTETKKATKIATRTKKTERNIGHSHQRS